MVPPDNTRAVQRGRQELAHARLATEADLQVARSGLQKGRASQLLDILQRLRSIGRLGHDLRWLHICGAHLPHVSVRRGRIASFLSCLWANRLSSRGSISMIPGSCARP